MCFFDRESTIFHLANSRPARGLKLGGDLLNDGGCLIVDLSSTRDCAYMLKGHIRNHVCIARACPLVISGKITPTIFYLASSQPTRGLKLGGDLLNGGCLIIDLSSTRDCAYCNRGVT